MEKTIILAVLFILLIPSSIAFGATPPYWKDRPLTISPGEEKIVPIVLQNMIGERDVILKAEIISGKEIAEILDSKEYLVPLGRNDIKLNIKIKIPEKTKKDKYIVSISFTEIPKDEGKMLQIAGSTLVSFPVLMQNPQEKRQISKSQSPFLLILIITTLITLILIVALSIYLVKKRKSPKP